MTTIFYMGGYNFTRGEFGAAWVTMSLFAAAVGWCFTIEGMTLL